MGHLKSFAPKTSREAYLDAARFVQKIFNEQGVTAHRTAAGTQAASKRSMTWRGATS